MHLFDQGWEKLREQIFANQKRLGVIPYLLQIRLRGSDPPDAGCQLIPSCRSYPCVGKS
jgi:hypothetical protein